MAIPCKSPVSAVDAYCEQMNIVRPAAESGFHLTGRLPPDEIDLHLDAEIIEFVNLEQSWTYSIAK
jgi:hypothetical protein